MSRVGKFEWLWVRDPVSGVYSVISGPGSVCPCPCPWFGACLCFAKSNEKWFCDIVDDPWWFLDEFWWVLISFPLFFEGFEDFAGFLCAAGHPVPVVPMASVFLVFCRDFKGGK